METVCLSYPLPVFAVCGHHLSPRIAIVLSLLSSLPNSCMSHPSNFLISSTNTFRSSLYISHYPFIRVLLSIVVPHGHMCTSTSSSSRLLVYLFCLVGPGPLHEIAISAFRVVHWAVQIRFHSNIFPQPPVYLSSVCPLSPYFLALAFPSLLSFLLLLSCTRQTSLRTVPFLGLINPSIFFRLFYPMSFHFALLSFSPIQPYQLWLATSFPAYSLLTIVISTFSRLYQFQEGTFLVPLLISNCSSPLSILVSF